MSTHPNPSRDRGVVLEAGANSYFPHMVGQAIECSCPKGRRGSQDHGRPLWTKQIFLEGEQWLDRLSVAEKVKM